MSEAPFIHDIVRKRSLRRAHRARLAEQIAMASQQTTQEEDFVTVWVGERPDDGKKATSPAAETTPSTAPVQSATDCSASNCSGVATQLFSHELWLLFMLGWIFPPVWMYVAVAWGFSCSSRRMHLAQLTASDRAAWLASSFMAAASTAIILGCAIHFGLQRSPATAGPVTLGPVYYTLQGPAGSLSKAPMPQAASSVAKAFHAAMGLPATYQVSLIHAELVQSTPDLIALPSTSRHLLETSTFPQHMHEDHASTDPAGQLPQKPPDEQIFMRHLLQEKEKVSTARELLADPPVTLSTAVWAISLLSSPDIPDAAALSKRAEAEDAGNDLVLQLVVTGYVDASSLAEVRAACTLKQDHALKTANTTMTESQEAYPKYEALPYPPEPMPEAGCVCRLKWGSAVQGPCASPWSAAGISQVQPALTIVNGSLVEKETGKPAQLRGVNWHGWNSDGTMNVDGLWAWQDWEVPDLFKDGNKPISEADKNLLQLSWLGKRTMTNDFATVVHRMKLLGFNAIRLQFVFKKLMKEIDEKEIKDNQHACVHDNLDYIGVNKTLDLELLQQLIDAQQPRNTTATPPGDLNSTASDMNANGSISNSTVNSTNSGSDSTTNGTESINKSTTTSSNSTNSMNSTTSSATLPAGAEPPQMTEALYAQLKARLPAYTGMPHPPPATNISECNGPWSVPFLPAYNGPMHPANSSGNLSLTQCNYYLPAAPKVAGLHRFLWQVQYLISQGFYVLLDFNSQRDWEPNLVYGQLLGHNWGTLWRILTDLPEYKEHMAGRVFPDLANEPSRWNCQWGDASYWKGEETKDGKTVVKWSRRCAPIIQSFGMAAASIWKYDRNVPIMLNGLGQNRAYYKDQSGGNYESMTWGDGFITDKDVVKRYNLSDPSQFLTTLSQMAGPGIVLAPHLYPPSITRNPPESLNTNQKRWNLSWGWKMQGRDKTSQGNPIPKLPVIVGEISAYDQGSNSNDNIDTTKYNQYDKTWLSRTAKYLKDLGASSNQGLNYFLWCWNANSHDTKGIVGPETTWREVQWTKVRMLIKEFDLKPWYCKHYPAFCDQVQ